MEKVEFETKLHNITDGETEIDIKFREALAGRVFDMKDVCGVDAKWTFNLMMPALVEAVGKPGYTELQILKAVCVYMQESVSKLQELRLDNARALIK